MPNRTRMMLAIAILLMFAAVAWAATISRFPYGIATPYWYNYSAGSAASYYLAAPTLSANDTAVGVTATQTLTNKTLSSPTISGAVTVSGALSGASPLVLEGATSDDYETTIAVTDPTADRTVTIPDATGTMNVNCTATKNYGGGSTEWVLSAAEAQCGYITVSNASGAVAASLPAAIPGKTYTVYNGSGHTLTFRVTGQTGGTIANAKWGFYTTLAADVAEIYELP